MQTIRVFRASFKLMYSRGQSHPGKVCQIKDDIFLMTILRSFVNRKNVLGSIGSIEDCNNEICQKSNNYSSIICTILLNLDEILGIIEKLSICRVFLQI